MPSPATGASGHAPAPRAAPGPSTQGVDPVRAADRWRAGAIEGGKDESGVGYVKRNAIAGRVFASWEAFEAHLLRWMRTIADARRHGTTGEPPIDRFLAAEASRLQPLNGRPPYHRARELRRQVQADGTIELDTNHYSVPWRLIGLAVTVEASEASVRILQAGAEVARHQPASGRRQRVIDARHLEGVVGLYPSRPVPTASGADTPVPAVPAPDLLRPLAEYEAVLGGGW